MRPWIVVTIGLGVAAVAGYVLLTSGPIAGGPSLQAEPVHGEIGEESRQQLLEILREADRDGDER